MKDEMKSNSVPISNSVAKASLTLSAIFLTLSIIVLATFQAGYLNGEFVFLGAPVNFAMGLFASLLGARGLRAAKRIPGEIGRRESMAGCAGGLMAAILAVVTFLSWGSGFRQ